MKRVVFLLIAMFFCFGLIQNFSRAYAQTPTLALKDSIPLAEKAISKEKLDVSSHFLYSITLSGSGKGNYWYYTYRPKTPSAGDTIYIKVYMDGEVEIVSGPRWGTRRMR